MNFLIRLKSILLLAIIFINKSSPQITLPQQSAGIQLPQVIGIMQTLPDQRQDSTRPNRSSVLYAMELQNPDSFFGVVQNYPNPFSQPFDVHLHLTKNDSVIMSYYNSQKKLVSIAYRGYLLKGNYTYHVTKLYLSKGGYYIKTKIGQKCWVQRAVNVYD